MIRIMMIEAKIFRNILANLRMTDLRGLFLGWLLGIFLGSMIFKLKY